MKRLTLILLGAVAAGAAVWFLFASEDGKGERPDGQSVLRSRALIKSGKSAEGNRIARAKLKRDKIKMGKQVRQEKEKPVLLTSEEMQDEQISEIEKKILKALQAALDSGDLESYLAVVSLIQKDYADTRGAGSSAIPELLRQKIVTGLGWFGSEAVPELVGFVQDESPQVVEMTIDQIQQSLDDPTLSDRERSAIVIAAAKTINDSDALDYMFMQINDMRPSVGVATIVAIEGAGTEAARSILPDTIEFFTGDSDVRTAADAQSWLVENPDDPEMAEFYDGIKE